MGIPGYVLQRAFELGEGGAGEFIYRKVPSNGDGTTVFTTRGTTC